MSYTFTLYGRKSYFSVNLENEINLQEGIWSIGLIDLHTYNHISNINEKRNELFIGSTRVIIPSGCYEIKDIDEFINSRYKTKDGNKVLTLSTNRKTLKCEMLANLKVDLTSPNLIAPILGFGHKIYTEKTRYESEFPIRISPVEDINVLCNIAQGALVNGVRSNVIYGFYPKYGSGMKIIQTPEPIIYYPINVDQISDIKIKIVDQNFEEIDNGGELFTVRLHLKRNY